MKSLQPEHLPGIAAETLLLAARTLKNATVNRKPARAALLPRMLRQLPIIATQLTVPSLEADCRALAAAYEVGDGPRARQLEAVLMQALRPLCH